MEARHLFPQAPWLWTWGVGVWGQFLQVGGDVILTCKQSPLKWSGGQVVMGMVGNVWYRKGHRRKDGAAHFFSFAREDGSHFT